MASKGKPSSGKDRLQAFCRCMELAHEARGGEDGKAAASLERELRKIRKRLNELQHAAFRPAIDYSRDPRFINRELSWLQFNLRVLQEARDRQNPLMERFSFLSITASNLDEFFMVRAASLKDMVNARYVKPDIAGLRPQEQLDAIAEQTHAMTNLMYTTYNRTLLPALAREDVRILDRSALSPEETEQLHAYFREYVYPILTPMAVDNSRPFPLISNRSLNVCALLRAKGEETEHKFVTIQVPAVIPRLYRFQDAERYVLLEDIIRLFLGEIFPQREIVAHSVYRIMRNADLEIDEEESADLLVEIEKQLRLRRWGEVIRLEAEDTIDDRFLLELLPNLKVPDDAIYFINGPLDLTFCSKLRAMPSIKRNRSWYYPAFEPQMNYLYRRRLESLAAKGEEKPNIFQLIREGSILLYHPYDAFAPVMELLRQAASDPNVLAIKQTLYRVSGASPLIAYLEEAARNGKQVMVLVELKARFDEENNIHWARRLEKAGCHVIYGLVGLKTHSKITLIVRREEGGIQRYLHLGTGNYNDQTAKLYTDMGYLINTAEVGEDAVAFFNMLSGFAEPTQWNALSVAPLWLRGDFERLIRREMTMAKQGRKSGIIAKMNSLVDKDMIELLYEASQAGVPIQLIVRGICCIRPGVPGLSETITVRSLVGRFLEHARIYRFENGGRPELYLSSADWMTRNLSRRVELMFPICEEDCRAYVQECLDLQLADNCRAHVMAGDGSYKKADRRGKPALDAQLRACQLAEARAKRETDIFVTRVFETREKEAAGGDIQR